MTDQIKHKAPGARNRREGHKLERDIAKSFRDIGFPHVVTTRSESRSRDNQQIDLINKDEAVNGRFPYNVQIKNSTMKVPYSIILSELPNTPGVTNVIIHKLTQKSENGKVFLPVGKYAILNLDDFMDMVKRLKQYESVPRS